MNLRTERITVLDVIWVVFIIICFLSNVWLNQQSEKPAYDENSLTIEQQGLRSSMLQEYAKNVIPVSQNLSDGRVKKLSTPEWYKEGKIGLTDEDKESVVDIGPANTPNWMYWTEGWTVGDYSVFITMLVFGLGFGQAFGIFLGMLVALFPWKSDNGPGPRWTGLTVWMMYGVIATNVIILFINIESIGRNVELGFYLMCAIVTTLEFCLVYALTFMLVSYVFSHKENRIQ